MRHHENCPNCGKKLCSDIRTVNFITSSVPAHALSVQLLASWCTMPGCYQVTSQYNVSDAERHLFIDEVCRARDIIQQIADGEIERGQRRSQYDAERGLRKMRMSDAREQARIAVDKINKAVNRFEP